MLAFELADVLQAYAASGRIYHEFLRVPTMSMGIYKLAVGAVDGQSPHSEDEVYYVISGRGVIRVNDDDQPVQAGSTIYVKAYDPHKFHSITEDLTLLVFFAPAEYSLAENTEE